MWQISQSSSSGVCKALIDTVHDFSICNKNMESVSLGRSPSLYSVASAASPPPLCEVRHCRGSVSPWPRLVDENGAPNFDPEPDVLAGKSPVVSLFLAGYESKLAVMRCTPTLGQMGGES